MNPMKRTSLIVYEADIFKCSQQLHKLLHKLLADVFAFYV
jgi:alpha-mannosidase